MINIGKYIPEHLDDKYRKYVSDCSDAISSALLKKRIAYNKCMDYRLDGFGVCSLSLEIHDQSIREWVFLFLFFVPSRPFPLFTRPLSDGLNNLLNVESDPKRKVTFVINTVKETNWYSYQKYLNSMDCHSDVSLLFFNTETNCLTDEIYISLIHDFEIRLVIDKTDSLSYLIDQSTKELFERIENFVYENEDRITEIDNEDQITGKNKEHFYSHRQRFTFRGLDIYEMYFGCDGHLVNVIAMYNQREHKFDEFGYDEIDFSTPIRLYVNIDEADKKLSFETNEDGEVIIEDVAPDEFFR